MHHLQRKHCTMNSGMNAPSQTATMHHDQRSMRTIRHGVFKKGLSQTELAHKLHVSASAVGMYEQGQREPYLDTIVLLTQEFEVTVDYLPTGHCICSQDIHHRSQVFHYMQKEIQGNVRTLFPDLVFPQEIMVIVAALLLDETTG